MIPDKPRHCKPQQQALPLKFIDETQHGKDFLRNWQWRFNKEVEARFVPRLRRFDRSLCN